VRSPGSGSARCNFFESHCSRSQGRGPVPRDLGPHSFRDEHLPKIREQIEATGFIEVNQWPGVATNQPLVARTTRRLVRLWRIFPPWGAGYMRLTIRALNPTCLRRCHIVLVPRSLSRSLNSGENENNLENENEQLSISPIIPFWPPTEFFPLAKGLSTRWRTRVSSASFSRVTVSSRGAHERYSVVRALRIGKPVSAGNHHEGAITTATGARFRKTKNDQPVISHESSSNPLIRQR
jgi:hypothetical protein